ERERPQGHAGFHLPFDISHELDDFYPHPAARSRPHLPQSFDPACSSAPHLLNGDRCRRMTFVADVLAADGSITIVRGAVQGAKDARFDIVQLLEGRILAMPDLVGETSHFILRKRASACW